MPPKTKYLKKAKAKKTIDTEVNKILKKHGIVKAPQMKEFIGQAINRYIPYNLNLLTAFPFTYAIGPSSDANLASLLPQYQGYQFTNYYGGIVDGQEICLHDIEIRGYLNRVDTALYSLPVRMMLIEDMQPSQNDVNPVDTTTNTSLQVYNPNTTYDRLLFYSNVISSCYAPQPRKTFRVLYDKTIEVTAAGNPHNVVPIMIKHSFKNQIISYNENKDDAGPIQTTNRDIQFFIFTTAEAAVQINASTRTRFTNVV